MKVNIGTLLIVASKVQPGLDRERFVNAVRSHYARNKDSETVSSSAKVDKDGGDHYNGTHSVKIKKAKGTDARAIHWLSCISELVTLALGEIPKPADEVSEWLGKFVVIPETKPAPAPTSK